MVSDTLDLGEQISRIDRMREEALKLMAERHKLTAEQHKLTAEVANRGGVDLPRWLFALLLAGSIGSIIAGVQAALSLIGVLH